MTSNNSKKFKKSISILVTGAFGQVGADLIPALRLKHGKDAVLVLLAHRNSNDELKHDSNIIVEHGTVTDKEKLRNLCLKHEVTEVYHLASLLSVNGEKDPSVTFDVNLIGLKNVLDVAVELHLRVFWPSSIAAFGLTTPRQHTPQHCSLEPRTIYGLQHVPFFIPHPFFVCLFPGVTKVSGELMCQYYFLKHGLDVRSLRYPGIISWKEEPTGGTTDYSVAIFYEALRKNSYECFVRADTVLPLMYMDDCIKATLALMDGMFAFFNFILCPFSAPSENITVRTSYNLAADSYSAETLAAEVKRHLPQFQIQYRPDPVRQAIADSWPQSIDDSQARKDWGWKPDFTLSRMSEVMISNLRQKFSSSH